jgi:enoyl-CoA hydratase
MEYETILLTKAGGVATITLNRPEVLNAMSFQLIGELDQAITDVEADDEVGAVIITGAGERAFSAGADIHEQRRDVQEISTEEIEERRAIRSEYSWHMGICRKPTIGALNGLSYGGGAVLSSSLDMRVGCERSTFRFLAASYGRLNCTWTLPQQIGWPMAKELLFTGRVVAAEEAYRMGLLNHLVPPDQVMDKAMEIATAISNNHPDSVRGVKHLLVEDIGRSWQEMWQREKDYLRTDVRSPGVEDAFKEFIERRGR